jgi:hypothetical protein
MQTNCKHVFDTLVLHFNFFQQFHFDSSEQYKAKKEDKGSRYKHYEEGKTSYGRWEKGKKTCRNDLMMMIMICMTQTTCCCSVSDLLSVP